MSTIERQKEWDIFISHASEDKEEFVRPLAGTLKELGMSVWYDEFTLKPGDSLSRSIDKGIAASRCGLVVISPKFIQKNWPEYELRGLTMREMSGHSIIVPIWYRVDQKAVEEFSPSLADKIALSASGTSIQNIALKILMQVRPDLYNARPRNELKKLASGESVPELRRQVDLLNRQLEQQRLAYEMQSLAHVHEAGSHVPVYYTKNLAARLAKGDDFDTASRKAAEQTEKEIEESYRGQIKWILLVFGVIGTVLIILTLISHCSR
jgi:hypothetical protein